MHEYQQGVLRVRSPDENGLAYLTHRKHPEMVDAGMGRGLYIIGTATAHKDGQEDGRNNAKTPFHAADAVAGEIYKIYRSRHKDAGNITL
jgi:hypothetical protein